MKVKVEDISSVKKKLQIEIPADTVKAELDSAYKELKKNAKIKGFRPGKAPRSLLERMYKKDVEGGKIAKEARRSRTRVIAPLLARKKRTSQGETKVFP